MGRYCIVPECVSGTTKDRNMRKSLNIRQASLFSIPKDPKKASKWSKALGMNFNTRSKRNRICDFHFKDEDIVRSERHKFPDGTFQIIKRERWSLLRNAVPVNPEPRKLDNKISTVEVQEPLEELENQPCILRKPTLLSDNISGWLKQRSVIEKAKKHLKSQDELVHLVVHLPEQHLNKISQDESICVRSEDFSSSIGYMNNNETNMDEESSSDTMVYENSKNPVTFEDIKSFINLPPAWYYICKIDTMIFVHLDRSDFTEKIRLFVHKDMSLMVSFRQKRKFKLNLKISSPVELTKLFKKFMKAAVCHGTGMKEMSSSAKCCGVILSNESYKQQRRYSRCTACKVLRGRLLHKIYRQRQRIANRNARLRNNLELTRNNNSQEEVSSEELSFIPFGNSETYS